MVGDGEGEVVKREKTKDILAKIFGESFAQKYRESLQRAQEIPRQRLKEMKPYLIELLKESEDFKAQFGKFDVILVTTPANPDKFPPKKTNAGNWKVTMVWPGSASLKAPFISVFVADEMGAYLLNSIPEKPFILVGKLSTQNYMGDLTYSFRVAGIIDLGSEEL